jgi:hypothetical protein
MSTQLPEILCTDSQDMLVLSSIVTSHYKSQHQSRKLWTPPCIISYMIRVDNVTCHFSSGSDYTSSSGPPTPPQHESRPTAHEQRLGGSSHQGHTPRSPAHKDFAPQKFPRSCGVSGIDRQSHLGATVSTLLPAPSGAIRRHLVCVLFYWLPDTSVLQETDRPVSQWRASDCCRAAQSSQWRGRR